MAEVYGHDHPEVALARQHRRMECDIDPPLI
jgi:hypothetical protein